MGDVPRATGGVSPVRSVVFAYHDIGVACLEVLAQQRAHVLMVVTHADDPTETIWFASVAKRAAAQAIPVRFAEDPNVPGLVEEIRRLHPDLIFSFYYRRLLGPALLAVPHLGAVNLHGSLLPKYRGRAPVNWALIQGETVTGVTLHYMDERADHGDIIAQRAVPIVVEDTAFTLSRKLTAAAGDLFHDTYPLILSRQAPRIPQDHAAATRFGRRRPADGLIDWRASTWQIYNLVRAVTRPFPGAFTYWEGRRVFVWAARLTQSWQSSGPPGRVVGVGAGDSLEVATGDGILEVVRLQLEGHDEMDGARFAAAAFARGMGHVTFGGR